ncbi:MAG: phosphopyruvate hydratase [Oscillospiraceae bacterium]
MQRNECSITRIEGFELLDSRGNPTVGATVFLEGGQQGTASVPSGASTGSHEAHELRDGGSRYRGLGVQRAVLAIHQVLGPALCGVDCTAQERVDDLLRRADGTDNKEALGANALLAVSLACARAAAAAHRLPLYRALGGAHAHRLPVPMMNILNGGAHASNNVDIQEFMIVPVGAPSFSEALRWGSEIYHALGSLLRERGLSTGVGDEGGFAPDLPSDEAAIELILRAVETAGCNDRQVRLALDAAATEWVRTEGGYHLPKRNRTLSADQLIDEWARLCGQYPILSIEDGLGEGDWEGWRRLTERLGAKVQLVGDDLLVTNLRRLREGIRLGAGNAILIKPNQIGTLSETFDALDAAAAAGWGAGLWHRTGETQDTPQADLALARGGGPIKTGAPCRTDRTAKYNRLLAIERELGSAARYGG